MSIDSYGSIAKKRVGGSCFLISDSIFFNLDGVITLGVILPWEIKLILASKFKKTISISWRKPFVFSMSDLSCMYICKNSSVFWTLFSSLLTFIIILVSRVWISLSLCLFFAISFRDVFINVRLFSTTCAIFVWLFSSVLIFWRIPSMSFGVESPKISPKKLPIGWNIALFFFGGVCIELICFLCFFVWSL